jgi:hypothetical protein
MWQLLCRSSGQRILLALIALMLAGGSNPAQASSTQENFNSFSHRKPDDPGKQGAGQQDWQKGTGKGQTGAKGQDQQIIDAAIASIAPRLRQYVKLDLSVFRKMGEWAYLQGTPTQPNGQPLDWTSTPFADDWRADVMSDVVMVLLRKAGSGWQVVDFVIGPTDVAWYSWIGQHGVPEGLFHDP